MAEPIAILGGTFDPVHHGHLILARDALERLGLGRVVFMPAPSAPLRDGPPATSIEHRIAMLELALAGEERFELSLLEARRAGPSYTHDTVIELARLHPETPLLWLIGADQLGRLQRWHRIEELARLAEFACAARPGHSLAPPPVPGLRVREFSSRALELSASEIRARRAAGLGIRWLLPDAVLSYIEKHALYRN